MPIDKNQFNSTLSQILRETCYVSSEEIKSVKDLVSAEEWQLRVDLAATYRLVAMYGWDDMIFTHISVRVPGPEHHFLINPYGMLFEEITASSLVKVDLEGNIVMDSPYFVNPAVSPFTRPCIWRGKMPNACCICTRMMALPYRRKMTACCPCRNFHVGASAFDLSRL